MGYPTAMPKMSEAKWLGEHGSLPMDRYDVVCVHTIVGHDPALAAHFSTGNEGLISQARDTKFQSAANWQGNHRVIAIENEDTPPGWSNDLDFTKPQIKAIAEIIVWCYKTHGIPIVPCPDSRPGSRGVAYHRQGIDGNFGSFEYGGRIPGGEVWSKAYGKMCPGDRRIKTLLEVIIPMAKKMVMPPKPPRPITLGKEDMLLYTIKGTDSSFYICGGKLLRIKDQHSKASISSGGTPTANVTMKQHNVFVEAFGDPIDA